MAKMRGARVGCLRVADIAPLLYRSRGDAKSSRPHPRRKVRFSARQWSMRRAQWREHWEGPQPDVNAVVTLLFNVWEAWSHSLSIDKTPISAQVTLEATRPGRVP